MRRKLLTSIGLLGILVLGGCTPATSSSSEISSSSSGGEVFVDKTKVFGMTDLSFQEEGVDYRYTHNLFQSMGVKSVRLWMHCNWIMNSPTEYSTSGLEKMRRIYNDIKDDGYQIIAMNHSNFHRTGMINSSSTTAKPARDLSEGSDYLKWLNDLETTYYNMVLAFPDIEYWEIDNECNNDDFMPRLGGGLFTLDEKAQIYYDMMYFASRGIHRANPDAITVMGGIVVNNAETFLNKIYDLIYSEDSWSKNTDDYFQVACWHPYMSFFSKNKFIELNNSIYSVVKTREGKDKKVFLTEFGFSEGAGFTVSEQATYLRDVYDAVLNDLYYVESLHYFRMYDNYASTWGSDAEKTFGLYYDPTMYKEADGVKIKEFAEPKETAFVYQDLAGGTGNLREYEEFLKGNFVTKLVMHRGYSASYRENTVSAFEAAAEQADVYGIETDVYLTSDNKPILIHDNNTSRVTLGKYNLDVTTSTFDQLRSVKLPDMMGNPNVHDIPTIEEYTDVLNKYGKVGFLEFKENFSYDELDIIMNEVKEQISLDKMVFISFHKDTLIRLRERYEDVEIMLLVNRYSEVNDDELIQYNFGLDCEVNGITMDQIDHVMSNKIKVNVWTVDSKDNARKYGIQGIDYLTTNSITSFKD